MKKAIGGMIFMLWILMAEVIYGAPGEALPIRFSGQETGQIQELTYGTKDYRIEVDQEHFLKQTGFTKEEAGDSIYSYSVKPGDSEKILKVDPDGRVIPLKADSKAACVIVTREDVGGYKGTSEEYWIRVNPKEVIPDESYRGLLYEKIYDKKDRSVFHEPDTGDILSGVEKIPLLEPLLESEDSGIESGDEVYVKHIFGNLLEGSQEVHDTGKKATVQITELELGGKDAGNYQVNLEKNRVILAVNLTVKKRVIRLKVSDGERQYGHWNEVDYKDPDPVKEWREGYENTEIQGLLDGDQIVFPKPTEVAIEEGYYPDYPEKIWESRLTVYSVDEDGNQNGNPGENYEFDFDRAHIQNGNLRIIREKISQKQLKLADQQKNLYMDSEGQIWTDTENQQFHIDMRETLSDRYDSVYVKTETGEIRVDSGASGYDFSEKSYEDGQREELQVYLKNTKNGVVSDGIRVSVRLDGNAPKLCEITASKEVYPLVKGLDKITFGTFHKVFSEMVETVKISDENGCGVKEWALQVMEGKQDQDFTGEAIERYIDPRKNTCTWKKMDSEKLTGSIAVPKKETPYIVLVKATDHVGHTKIYASNGVILDGTAPQVAISLAENQVFSPAGIYSDDVSLRIHVEDTGKEEKGVVSAIQKVEVLVKNRGEITQKECLFDLKKETKKASWKLRELKQYGSMELLYTIDARKNNSNDIKAIVTLTDNGGNVCHAEFSCMIDITKPQIRIVKTSEAQVKNRCYYRKPVQMEILYTERNFLTEKQNLWFSVETEEGRVQKYSLEELETQLNVRFRWENLGEAIQQDQKKTEELTDARQHKLILIFGQDGRYRICPCLKDSSVQSETFEGEVQEFTVDQTAPVLQVEYRNRKGEKIDVPKREKDRIYRNEAIGVYLTVKEKNFALKGQKVPIVITLGEQGRKDAETWEKTDEDCHSSHYWIEKDAKYSQSVVYTDLAGNQVSYGPGYFTVDQTKPNGKIEVKGFGFWERLLEKITFGLFSPADVDVIITGNDALSSVQPIQFFVCSKPKTREELERCREWRFAPEENPGVVGISIKNDRKFIVYSKVVDQAGNYEFFSSDGVVIDQTEPSFAIKIMNEDQSREHIFKEDVILQIEVKDRTDKETYSGLKKVWYTVSAEGNMQNMETISLFQESRPNVKGPEIFKQEITIPAKTYNSNTVKLQVFAEDQAGNQGKSEVQKLKIDVSKPEISISWKEVPSKNGRYYREPRRAVLMIKERNFNPEKVKIKGMKPGGKQGKTGSWRMTNEETDESENRCELIFEEDGVYTFIVECEDQAGNLSRYEHTEEFVIDRTRPQIQVSYDNGSVKNGRFYDGPRTATITIHEHNFSEKDVKTVISSELKDKNETIPSISRFTKEGDCYTALIHYRADGNYEFSVAYTDLAGNQAETYQSEVFTIDCTKPGIQIIGLEDHSANRETVAPKIEITDENFDAKAIQITLEGAKRGIIMPRKKESMLSNGICLEFFDFPREKQMDDRYHMTVRATDQAGNHAQQQITFSVNRFGSIFLLGEETQSWLLTREEGYRYLKREEEIVIYEINVDPAESRTITINRDGELFHLKENQDYLVEESDPKDAWSKICYRIKKENFSEEGHYAIILNTEDKAKNRMNNGTIAFAVDKTAPTVVVSGIQTNTRYRTARRTVRIDAKDNLALSKVKLQIDGIEKVYDKKEVIEEIIHSKNHWQDIEITAWDAAGNQMDSPISLKVLITPNVWIQYYMNKPVFYGSLFLSMLGLAAVTFLVWKKKRTP